MKNLFLLFAEHSGEIRGFFLSRYIISSSITIIKYKTIKVHEEVIFNYLTRQTVHLLTIQVD